MTVRGGVLDDVVEGLTVRSATHQKKQELLHGLRYQPNQPDCPSRNSRSLFHSRNGLE